MTRYYLAEPYIQVYAYETRLLGRDTLKIGVRSISIPNPREGYLIDHNYNWTVDDNLQITTSPEGLLEYIGYRREPRAAAAVAAAARMAVSLAAPLPSPLKGEDGLPEFSRLVYSKNIKLTELLACNSQEFHAGGRTFRIAAKSDSPLIKDIYTQETQKPGNLNWTETASVILSARTDIDNANKRSLPRESVKGVHYRPLLPVAISVEEMHSNDRKRTAQLLALKETPTDEIPVQLLGREVIPNTRGDTTNSYLSGNIKFNNLSSNPTRIGYFPTENSIELIPASGGETVLRIKEVEHPNATPGNARHLVEIERGEAPISLEEIVFCPDPFVVDTFFIPSTFVAPQAYELHFAGGSVYDVIVTRKSELMSAVGSISEVVGDVARIPANIFTFTIVHEDKDKSPLGNVGGPKGGDKESGYYDKKRDKESGYYDRRRDKE